MITLLPILPRSDRVARAQLDILLGKYHPEHVTTEMLDKLAKRLWPEVFGEEAER